LEAAQSVRPPVADEETTLTLGLRSRDGRQQHVDPARRG
jgi:hypothetical protein